MAFPTYGETTVTDFGADATAHAANMPATVNPGDLLLAIAAFDEATTTITTPSGWSQLLGDDSSTSQVFGLYAKVAVGDEDSTTVDFVTSNTQRGSVHVLRFGTWAGHLGGVMIARAVANSVAIPGLALAVGVTARDIHWVVAQYKSSVTTWGAVPPTGYSNEAKSGVGEDATASASIASATRTNAAQSEDLSTVWNAGGFTVLVAVLPVGGAMSVRPQSQIGV